MSRYVGPKCRLCRREGVKLFLKGSRCDSPKCAITKRGHPPGVHPWTRNKRSEYGTQLREKQKTKRVFGMYERPFRRFFARAARSKGNTGEMLIQLLERRLDNVVFLSGLATSRSQARQLLVHGHFMLNARRVRTPSLTVRQGDVVTVNSREKSRTTIKGNHDLAKGRNAPSWLEVDAANLEVRVNALPTRDEASLEVQEQLIIEFCSK